jgi:hypothetical protein
MWISPHCHSWNCPLASWLALHSWILFLALALGNRKQSLICKVIVALTCNPRTDFEKHSSFNQSHLNPITVDDCWQISNRTPIGDTSHQYGRQYKYFHGYHIPVTDMITNGISSKGFFVWLCVIISNGTIRKEKCKNSPMVAEYWQTLGLLVIGHWMQISWNYIDYLLCMAMYWYRINPVAILFVHWIWYVFN